MTIISPAGGRSPGRWLVLALLSMAMMVSFIDRYALTMMLTPIKTELHLSDTSLGFLTGFAFSAFYSTFGFVMARVSDRGAHRAVLVGSLLVWSAATALTGAVRNLWQVSLARFAVGAGEAGVAPTSHAIIASTFPPNLRSGALAIFSAAGPLGILIAFAVSAPLEASFGWRWAFVILGIPGVFLAAVFFGVGKGIGASAEIGGPARTGVSWARSIQTLLSIPRFRNVTLTIAGLAFLTFGQTYWLPVFMERSFGLSRAQIGPLLAMTQGIGMLVGMVLGGWLFDTMARRDERWRVRLLCFCLIGGAPIVVATYSVNDPTTAAWLAGIAAFVLALPSGQLFAEVQESVTPETRATGAATCLLVTSFIGHGLGPFLIGALSDVFSPRFGAQSLRYALLGTISVAGVWMTVQTILMVRGISAARLGRAGSALAGPS